MPSHVTGPGEDRNVAAIAQGVVFRTPDSDPRNSYHPSVNVLSPSEWLVSFDVGTTTETLDYHTRRCRTVDAGRSWTDEGPLVEKPAGPPTTHTIRTRRLADRHLVGFGKWENRLGYETHRSNRETLGQVPMRLFWIESRDGGRTWSGPQWIETPFVGPTWELSHPIIPLPGGRWGAPVATWRGWNGELPNGELTGILVSEDAGKTWPRFITSFDGKATGYIHWEQSAIVRRDGSMLATAWVYDPKQKETRPSIFATSPDSATNFRSSVATGFLAQTCKIIELESGQIVAAYRRHDRPGLWVEVAAVTPDRWQTERRGLLWSGASGMEGRASTSEELNSLRFGYPSLALLPEGEVLITFWGTQGGKTAIYWIRFKPSAIPPV